MPTPILPFIIQPLCLVPLHGLEHFSAIRSLWASRLSSLSLSFLVCKMMMAVIPASLGYCGNEVVHVTSSTVPAALVTVNKLSVL